MQSCCISGHRLECLPWGYNESDTRHLVTGTFLSSRVLSAIDKGVTTFYTSCAPGVDMMAGELIAAMRGIHNRRIRLLAVVPFAGQEEPYSEPVKKWYFRLLSNYDEVTVMQDDFTENCREKSGRYMLDRSDMLITAFHNEDSVSGDLFRTAQEKGLFIARLNTETFVEENYIGNKNVDS